MVPTVLSNTDNLNLILERYPYQRHSATAIFASRFQLEASTLKEYFPYNFSRLFIYEKRYALLSEFELLKGWIG